MSGAHVNEGFQPDQQNAEQTAKYQKNNEQIQLSATKVTDENCYKATPPIGQNGGDGIHVIVKRDVNPNVIYRKYYQVRYKNDS